MPKTVSIRRSLILNLILVITLLSGAIMITLFLGARTAVRTLSRIIITQTIEQTEGELKRFFESVAGEILEARSLSEKGMINIDDSENLRNQFMSLMSQNPQITSLMLADTTGREFMLLRTGSKWLNRLTDPGQDKNVHIFEWADNYQKATKTWKKLDYDPRKMPWYIGAESKYKQVQDEINAKDSLNWTEPYKFFTTKDPGITVSTKFKTNDGTELVIGFDIMLKDIQTFTDQLKVLSHGQVVILTTGEVRRIIGYSVKQHFNDEVKPKEVTLKSPMELGIVLFDDIINAFRSQGATPDKPIDVPIRFASESKVWWGATRRFSLSSDRHFLTAVIVPESDLLGSLKQKRIWVITISFIALVLGGLRALVLANRYSQPIEALVAASDRISKGDLEPSEPVKSKVSEVHQLADAHERMRQGLQTLMKMERDIQIARQIQQKTLPQRLPEMSGFDIDGWNEPAEETGGDTYDIIGYRVQDGNYVQICNNQAEKAILLLADATGHGIGPALSVTQLRAMLRMAVHINPDISMIAKHMNEQLCIDLPSERFITAWLGEIDTSDNTLEYFSAGQAPLLYYMAATREVLIRNANSVPLGIIEEIDTSIVEKIQMNTGDIFAVISDGIFESMDSNNDQYETDRAIEIIKKSANMPAKDIIKALQRSVNEFTANAPADDDRTIIIIKCV
jgi:serine phosphatase RsbU (regulator of sigma subunit)